MVGRIKKTPRAEPKEGTVYLDKPPCTEWTPSASPDCLKLETWLRINKIPYEYFDHESVAVSTLPHCKVGGKDIPYSNNTLSEITNAVSKESTEAPPTKLSPYDSGVQRAFEGLIEGSLHWVLIYMRATQANQLPPCDGFQGRFWQVLRPIANKVVASKLKTKADYQGIGRQNASDVVSAGKEDLRAISAYLGDNTYLTGSQPTKLDATAFAHLSQFYFIPNDNELKTFMKDECPNLVTYIERMKEDFWPDWEDKCRKPPPPRRTKSKDETAAATGQEKTEDAAKTEQLAETATNGHSEKEPVATNGQEPVAVIVTKQVETVEVVTSVVENKPASVENGEHGGTANGASSEKASE